MFILTSDQKSIIDSCFVQRFCLIEKPDAVLLLASYSADFCVTVGKYADKPEAHAALSALFSALSSGSECFSMPDSRMFGVDCKVHDARTRRKGGS